MSIFDDIKTGLNQAIDFEKGKGKARVFGKCSDYSYVCCNAEIDRN